jgi:hypothetical protein
MGQFGRNRRRNGEKFYLNLKKQSQFAGGQNDAKYSITKVYGVFNG